MTSNKSTIKKHGDLLSETHHKILHVIFIFCGLSFFSTLCNATYVKKKKNAEDILIFVKLKKKTLRKNTSDYKVLLKIFNAYSQNSYAWIMAVGIIQALLHLYFLYY